jgi:hypothetical protein
MQNEGPSDHLALQRRLVQEELLEMEATAFGMAQLARGRARLWGSLYFVVGLPAAILAAVAGGFALASSAYGLVAGIFALTSAGLTAAATFLDSATRQTSANNLAAGWQVLGNEARMRLLVDTPDDDWLVRQSRGVLEDMANRERKLLEGKAPDAEAEAERRAERERGRAENERIRAQAEAARGEALADQARAAEQALRQNPGAAPQGRALATMPRATAAQSPGPAVPQSPESSEVNPH